MGASEIARGGLDRALLPMLPNRLPPANAVNWRRMSARTFGERVAFISAWLLTSHHRGACSPAGARCRAPEAGARIGQGAHRAVAVCDDAVRVPAAAALTEPVLRQAEDGAALELGVDALNRTLAVSRATPHCMQHA
jgi:hypothetical protein